MRARSLSPEDEAEVVLRYGMGWTMRRLGEHFGVDKRSIQRVLDRAGVTDRPPPGPRPNPDLDARIKDLRLLGWSWQKIGDEVGLSRHGARKRYLAACRSRESQV